MTHIWNTTPLAFVIVPLSLFVASCAPTASASEKLVGRWENTDWKFGGRPLMAQFTADGKMEYTSSNANIGKHKGTWTLLESGELLIASDTGREARCKIVVADKTLTFATTNCVDGWEKFAGEHLVKQ